MWKWGLPWYWADDVAHETIHLKGGREPFQPQNMPLGFKHVGLGGGNSYENPIKYVQDILKLENQLHERFRDGGNLNEERYHLFYLCKSFNYTGYSIHNKDNYKYFPYGKDQLKIFLERGIFYYDKFLSNFKDTGEEWYIRYLKADLLEKLGRSKESVAEYFISHTKRVDRGEPLARLFWNYYYEENWEMAFEFGQKIKNLKCPIEYDCWQIELDAYFENCWQLRDAIGVTCERIGSKNKDLNCLKQAKEIFEELQERFNQEELTQDDNGKRIQGNIEFINKIIEEIN
jgi:hypothetical protein